MKTNLSTLSASQDPRRFGTASTPEGCLTAFNDLILQYQDAAYNFAFYLLGDADTADDITQQAFINAYLHIESFHGTQFRSWLFKIIKNACIDEMRRQKRHRTYSLENMEGEDYRQPAWDNLFAHPRSPEQVVEQAESARQIQAVMGGMDEAFRVVLVLIDIQEFDYQEVAQIIGVPLGTVKSRLARARRQFRTLMEQ